MLLLVPPPLVLLRGSFSTVLDRRLGLGHGCLLQGNQVCCNYRARIAFLQGERKGQENLKRDLIRRIKMLEFALKQERTKLHKLKYGAEVKIETKFVETIEDFNQINFRPANLNSSWRNGRQLLQQYLHEVGYSDEVLDARSQRVCALLGKKNEANTTIDKQMKNCEVVDHEKQMANQYVTHANEEPENDAAKGNNLMITNDEDAEIHQEEVDSGDQTRPRKQGRFEVSEELNDIEITLAQFAFLNAEAEEVVDPKKVDWSVVDQSKLKTMKEQFKMEKRQTKRKQTKRPHKKNLQTMLDTLRGTEPPILDDIHPPSDDSLPYVVGGACIDSESIESALGLGDLAGLTVGNEAVPLSSEVSIGDDVMWKTWSPKYTLRCHFDGVRSVRFLPQGSSLITASEDHTMKLWNLNKPLPSKKTQALDVEPVYTFRGHTDAVLCLALRDDGSTCYSGGIDSTVRCWGIPSTDTDPYLPYDTSVEYSELLGHTDAVWSLSYSSTRQQLLSASSDLTVRLWNPNSTVPLLRTMLSEGDSSPTCVEFVKCDSNHCVTSYSDGKILVCDLESGKAVNTLKKANGCRINYVETHPTMSVTIAAHDDGHIKFFDNVSGKVIHSMVAHLDSVTSLSVDPNGLYLLSGSHDCSIRLWNMETKTCVQELTAHRKKFDESIHSVAFHPDGNYVASAGADAIVKVFV